MWVVLRSLRIIGEIKGAMLQIKVLGIGCPSCHKLEAMCSEVVDEQGIDAEIESITDMERFAYFGVIVTPALVINNELKVQGKLPLKPTLAKWIKQAAV